MSFTVPTFNLACDIWTCDATILPANGPADFTGVPTQKYINSRWPIDHIVAPTTSQWWIPYQPPVQFRFARAGLFAGGIRTWVVVCIECPPGTATYYRVQSQDVMHEGFPNEYAFLICVPCTDDGKAVPPPHGPTDTGIGSNSCGD